MSATNSTTNYNLPIFIASDSPKWLVDWNGAMNTIDSAINTVATAASGAAGDITTLQSDLQTLSGTVTTQGTSISTLTSSLSTLTGTVNTITSLIGNGEPTTTDKTIIGAINELHADIQQIVISVDAEDISYNNTTSGLIATNVQSAIDELENSISNIDTSALKGLLIIGNSYVEQGCTDKIADMFQNVYQKLAGGTGFATYTDHATDFEDQLDAAISDSSIINNNVTHIIFVSAMGDTRAIVEHGVDTYRASLNSTLASMKTKIATSFPNCKNAMVTFAECRNVASFTGNSYAALFRVHKAFKDYCAANDFWYMGWSGFNNMFNSSGFEADHYHPNAAGASIIGQFIKDSFQGTAEYREFYSQKSGATIGYTADSTSTVQTKLTPDTASIYIRNITGSGAVTIAANGTFLDLTQLPIPVPAPEGSIDIIADLRDFQPPFTNKDTLRLTIDNGSNGVAILKPTFNPTASTMSSTVKCEALGRLCYQI